MANGQLLLYEPHDEEESRDSAPDLQPSHDSGFSAQLDRIVTCIEKALDMARAFRRSEAGRLVGPPSVGSPRAGPPLLSAKLTEMAAGLWGSGFPSTAGTPSEMRSFLAGSLKQSRDPSTGRADVRKLERLASMMEVALGEALDEPSPQKSRALLRSLAILSSRGSTILRAEQRSDLPQRVLAYMRNGAASDLLGQLATQRLEEETSRAIETQGMAFRSLSKRIRSRGSSLYEWCALAVDISLNPVLDAKLRASLPPERVAALRRNLQDIKVLEILLNVTQDDLSDYNGDIAALELVARATYPRSVCDAVFCTALARRAKDGQRIRKEDRRAVAVLARLNREVGQAITRRVVELVGAEVFGRYEKAWNEAHRRVLASMLYGAMQNACPELLDTTAEEFTACFGSRDALYVEAGNGNRVTFELIDLMLLEALEGRARLTDAQTDAIVAGFRDLEMAQQLCNCISTLRREIYEGDRSNVIINHAISQFVECYEAGWELRIDLRNIYGITEVTGGTPKEILGNLLSALKHAVRSGHLSEVRDLGAFVERLVRETRAKEIYVALWEEHVERAGALLGEGYRLASLGASFDERALEERAAELMALHCVFLDEDPDDVVQAQLQPT